MKQLKIYTRPRTLFLTLFVAAFVLINLVDAFYGSTATITGTFFLSQSVAIIVTTLVVLVKAQWRSATTPWAVASIATLLIILFSFTTFHYGPRIITEADGPASIGYICELGEEDRTVIAITGDYYGPFTANNLTTNLCMLKNMPLAASNASPYSLDYNNDGLVLLGIYEIIVLLSYFVVRKLVTAYWQSKSAIGRAKA